MPSAIPVQAVGSRSGERDKAVNAWVILSVNLRLCRLAVPEAGGLIRRRALPKKRLYSRLNWELLS